MDEEENCTAYHEAGHAVVACALGAEIESVQLGGEADEWLPERFGECRIRWGRVQPNAPWQLEREMLAVLAGPVAETLYRNEKPDWEVLQSWQYDWQIAWSHSAAIAKSDLDRAKFLRSMISWLQIQLASDSVWAAIAAVADEILAHEFIEGHQVEQAVDFWLNR